MSTKNPYNYPAAGPIATFGVVIVMGLLAGLVFRMSDPKFRPKDKVWTSGVTAATAFRLEEANALSEARKIIQESTNTTNHAP